MRLWPRFCYAIWEIGNYEIRLLFVRRRDEKMDKPFQRKGAESNTQVGRDFEAKAQIFFALRGLHLTPGMVLEIGRSSRR